LLFPWTTHQPPKGTNDREGNHTTPISIAEGLKMPIDTSAPLYMLLAAHVIVGAIASVATGLVLCRAIRRLIASWRSMKEKRDSGTSRVHVEGPGCTLPLAN
jgi:hypothetical protein